MINELLEKHLIKQCAEIIVDYIPFYYINEKTYTKYKKNI